MTLALPTFVAAAPRTPRRARSRAVQGRVAWAVLLAATLVLKTFVPLLAALAAELQGKAVADVCAVYGVRLAPAPAAAPEPHRSDPHQAHHEHHAPREHHAHGEAVATAHAAMAGAEAAVAPSHEDAPEHADHARDHCALTGLAVCALVTLAAWDAADWTSAAPELPAANDAAPARDASARWLTARVHAPPAGA